MPAVAFLVRNGLLALFAGLLFGVAPASAAPTRPQSAAAARTQEAPRPAIWLLADEDTRIYLFGTIHILPPDLQWRSAEFDRIVADADELVMEIADSPGTGPGDESAIGPLMLLGKSVPITQRVSPARRDGLRRMIAASGLPIETFDQMQTWAAAVSLAAIAVAQEFAGDSGVAPEALTGVEDALRADFAARGRPISGVETTAQQLGFFAQMPLHAQRAMLESMVDSFEAGEGDILDPDEDGWVRGDLTRIAAEMEAMPPELFEPLLVRRNRAWTDWLITRLDQPGTILFAVGAGHLAGRVSVQTMLEGRGFTVRRLN